MNTTHIHEDPSRTTPVGLARYAAEFMEAAIAAEDKMGTKPGHELVAPIPVLFLVGQAIELALKAFLLSRGVTLRELRTHFGHGLHRSFRKAKELGLLSLTQVTAEEQSVLEVLDDLYSSKQLQYIVTGAKAFPVFGPLERVALKFIYAIGREVGFRPRNLPSAL
jgi:hypothetical protein